MISAERAVITGLAVVSPGSQPFGPVGELTEIIRPRLTFYEMELILTVDPISAFFWEALSPF